MQLIVGLGNPGRKYANTRHNVGFVTIDVLKEKLGISELKSNSNFACFMLQTTDYILAKPNTFMNDSGVAVKKLVDFYKVQMDNLWIIHDDLDIRLGEYKIQKGVGPKLHNGISSIEEKLGTKDFLRVRIGVDNRTPENRTPGERYVLQNFAEDEIEVRDKVVGEVVEELIKQVVDAK